MGKPATDLNTILPHIDDPFNPDRWSHAKHIAERVGISCSGLVSKLRALEGAGFLESLVPGYTKGGTPYPKLWRRAEAMMGEQYFPADDSYAFPMMPSHPLVLAIDANKDPDARDWAICNVLGISDRCLREWRSGKSPLTEFNVADKVILRLELLWWEVYDERTVPDPAVLARVRYAFTGEELELAA